MTSYAPCLCSARSVALRSTMSPPGHGAVRIDDEFVRHAGVECRITLGCGIEADDLRVDDLCDRQPVPQDCLQQLTVIPQHRRLAGVKAVRLRPTLAQVQDPRTVLCKLFFRSAILCA